MRAIYDADITKTDADWILDIETFERHVTDQFDRQLFVEIDSATSASSARAELDEALAAWPNATIEDRAECRQAVTSEIDMMLNLIYGLLALAIVIARVVAEASVVESAGVAPRRWIIDCANPEDWRAPRSSYMPNR